jgi:hypothetical protein
MALVGGNGSIDPGELHLRLLNLHDDFTECQARSVKKGMEQVDLLHAIQSEIVRFEKDSADKIVKLQDTVNLILEHVTKPKKKKRVPA